MGTVLSVGSRYKARRRHDDDSDRPKDCFYPHNKGSKVSYCAMMDILMLDMCATSCHASMSVCCEIAVMVVTVDEMLILYLQHFSTQISVPVLRVPV